MDSRAPRRCSPLAGLVLLTALSACSGGRSAPVTSPTPGPVGTHARNLEIPALEAFERAVTNGTRTRTGAPGPRYWQQWADYRLEAELNPVSKRLTGKGSVTYYNRSPDALKEVYVQLLHNIFAPDAGITPTFPGRSRVSSWAGWRCRDRRSRGRRETRQATR